MEKFVFHESSLCAKEVGTSAIGYPTWPGCVHTHLNISGIFEIWTQRLGPLWQRRFSISLETTIMDFLKPPGHFDSPHIKPLPKDSWKFRFLSGSCLCVHVSNKAWQVLDPSDAFICNTTHWLLSSYCSQTPTARQISLLLQYHVLLPC